MTSINSLQTEIDDLQERSDKTKNMGMIAERNAENYDANGIPDKANLERSVAAQRLNEVRDFKSNISSKESERQKLIAQVERIDADIANLENERSKLIG